MTPEQPNTLPEISPEEEGRGQRLTKLGLFNESSKPENLPEWLKEKPRDPDSTQLISGLESTDDDGDEDDDDNQETDDSDEDEIEGGTTRRF